MDVIKIDSAELGKDKCRICLEGDVERDWNDYLHEHMTYKDCYYKYTQLACFDGDNLYLSTMLCRNCSNSLENINAFISKAIETHIILQERLALNIKCESDNDIKTKFETVLITEAEIKPDIQNITIYENRGESDAWSLSEDNVVPQKRTRAKRKRKIKRENNQDDTKNSSSELQNKKSVIKKNYHCSKPWEIPTCCSICSKVLTSKYKAVAHEKTHLKDRERKEACIECGMKFYNKCALNLHKRTHDKNREKTKKCEFCDKAFYTSGDLNVHRRIHLGQMIQCNLCTKKYYRQVDLDKHMVSHSASRINKELKPKKKYFVCCEICGVNIRSCTYKAHYAKHMNEPLAKCAICNKEFFSRDSCISHLKKLHKKGNGERSDFVIAYKTNRYTNLFLQQTVSKIFSKE